MTTYLDCNATTPIEPAVRDIVIRYMEAEFGNAGSRTHEFGARAKDAVQRARGQIARVVEAAPDDVTFTSGATESLNLAILGLREHAERTGSKHIVATAIEHKAVLEPLEELERHGFEITLVSPPPQGAVDPEAIRSAVRSDTILVAVMHANNETGVIQPIEDVCETLVDHPAFLLVDAAQTFGKELTGLRRQRIDLIALSGHKVYAPKGIGALIARKRGFNRPPLRPLMFGGGQERSLRPGTLPVQLIVGLGLAAELAVSQNEQRRQTCLSIAEGALQMVRDLGGEINGVESKRLAHVLNVRFPGLDSETVMVGLKGVAAISNGSACTSSSYKPSHVLKAMGQSDDAAQEAVRISWSHLGSEVNWIDIGKAIQRLK